MHGIYNVFDVLHQKKKEKKPRPNYIKGNKKKFIIIFGSKTFILCLRIGIVQKNMIHTQ